MNFNTVQFERSFGTADQLTASDKPEISFAGRSNVGKSSLLNALFNRKKLAKVSQTPGKTATINFFTTQEARFVDLPGYGYAKTSKSNKTRWSQLVEGYFQQKRNVALVCSLIDIRHPATELDESMVSFLQESELPYLVVLTKGDKLSHSKAQQQREKIKCQLGIDDGTPLIITSSLKKAGIDELRATLTEYL